MLVDMSPETLKRLQDSTSSWHVGKRVGEQDYYVAVVDGKLGWTTDRSKRLKLSREEDAQAIEKLFPDAQFCVQLSIIQGGQST